ncbi:MAG: heparinase II/III-family protein [Armatimonadetes bacterium]|nr:heparinase II/III-family protein [Armatimonadota bacterium]
MACTELVERSVLWLALTAALLWAVTPVAAGGRALGLKHPVLDHRVDPAKAAQYEQTAATAMGMAEAQLLAFVPEGHFTRFCHCPECFGGVDADMVFSWSVERPDELKCRYCGFVWKPDGKYRETETLEGQNSLGETIRCHYYLDEKHQTKHFFSLNIALYEREWIIRQTTALGQAYVATGKPEYARRVALILDRMAQIYPHLPVIKVGGTPNRYFQFAPKQQPPYTWDAGKWGWHYPGGELPSGVIEAYDMVYASLEFDRLSAERGYDVRERLEHDFLIPVFEAVRANPKHIDNYVAYLGTAAKMGRVLNEPSWVHWAFGWIAKNINAGCFYDGMWHESASYHYMTTAGLRNCFASVRGYSDPPGYTDAADGRHFENLNPEQELPFWARVQHAPEVVDFPTGWSPPVHDVWAQERRSAPRQSTTSALLPGFGQASLGRGTGDNQMQALLHFSGAYGHNHLDNLSFQLWAKQREMLSDIGYTWSDIRAWCSSTISHNLVAVDGQDQGGRPTDGDLLWFFPATGGVSVVEADGRRGYSRLEGVDCYRRLLVLVPVSDRDAYVVDLFRARGGQMHDWLMHGDADEDMTAECSLPLADGASDLTKPPADLPALKPSASYAMLRDLRSSPAEAGFVTTFRYAAEAARGVRLHVLPPGPVTAFLGRSPSVRRVGKGTQGDNRKIYDYWMPHLVVRRQGAASLDSTFAAVMEPFAGEAFVQSVERLPLTDAPPGAVALCVRHGKTEDLILSTTQQPPFTDWAPLAGVRMRGGLVVIRRVAGQPQSLWLFGGEEVADGDMKLAQPAARYEGIIESAPRRADGAVEDAFITTADIPTGEALRGVWMVVTHAGGFTHGYPIERVEKRDGKTVIILSMDHGLRVQEDTTQEVYFPQRTFKGPNAFVIPLSAHVGT